MPLVHTTARGSRSALVPLPRRWRLLHRTLMGGRPELRLPRCCGLDRLKVLLLIMGGRHFKTATSSQSATNPLGLTRNMSES